VIKPVLVQNKQEKVLTVSERKLDQVLHHPALLSMRYDDCSVSPASTIQQHGIKAVTAWNFSTPPSSIANSTRALAYRLAIAFVINVAPPPW
jgi:hypothetical protein